MRGGCEGGGGRGGRGGRGEQKNAPLPRTTDATNLVARLEFHVGWSGWTKPPTMKGGGRGGVAWAVEMWKGE